MYSCLWLRGGLPGCASLQIWRASWSQYTGTINNVFALVSKSESRSWGKMRTNKWEESHCLPKPSCLNQDTGQGPWWGWTSFNSLDFLSLMKKKRHKYCDGSRKPACRWLLYSADLLHRSSPYCNLKHQTSFCFIDKCKVIKKNDRIRKPSFGICFGNS